jgi:hypothetical protein
MLFRRMSVATLTATGIGLALAGCGGSSGVTISTAAQAERQVRQIEAQVCHGRIRTIHCYERGSSWLCSFSASSGALDNGFLSLNKHQPAHADLTVAC